ncbi:TRAP transporter substrate-binding protein DctP [Nocardiopsis salina]|uniref:TRAP transporter substrate-binding protein DctP n=1 Tax=Nocardiopsis salina TaxID=245836 RepID=UPI00034C6327|nr:TRAP transporter substrate-binding protein DctP [Nocardiopsis salina]
MAPKPRQRCARFAAAMAGISALTACTHGVASDGTNTTEIELATFVGPSTPYGEALTEFAEQVSAETDGRVDLKIFWDGSLLPGEEILDGVSTGRVGMGYVNTSYHPTELPLSQLVSVPFQTGDTATAQAAWNELLETDEAFAAEWQSNNVVNLGIQSVTPMIISGPETPTGIEELSGQRVRATGHTARAVQLAGGSPVGLTINELYESLERGVIDSYTSMNLGTVPSLSLHEASPHIADPGLGIYSIVGLVVNQETFDGLNGADQEALGAAGRDLGDNYLETVERVEDEACSTIREAGGSVTVWDGPEVDAWRDLVGDELMNDWESDVAETGAGTEGEEFAAAYARAIEANPTDGEGALDRCANQ